MGVRRVGVNDITVESMDQFPNLKTSCQINLAPHDNWKNVHTSLDRPFLQRGTGLTNQVTGYPAFIETDQQIQGLLLSAPPGTLGVDVKNVHGIKLSPKN